MEDINKPIETGAFENQVRKAFKLKPGLNFANPANDYRQHLTYGDNAIIASGKLTDEAIEEMFKSGYKKADLGEDEDTRLKAVISRMAYDYLTSEVEDMDKYVSHIRDKAALISSFSKGEMEGEDAWEVAIFADMSSAITTRFAKAIDPQKVSMMLHIVMDYLKDIANKSHEQVGDTGRTQLQHFLDVARNGSPAHEDAHWLTKLMSGYNDITGQGQTPEEEIPTADVSPEDAARAPADMVGNVEEIPAEEAPVPAPDMGEGAPVPEADVPAEGAVPAEALDVPNEGEGNVPMDVPEEEAIPMQASLEGLFLKAFNDKQLGTHKPIKKYTGKG